MQLRLLRRSGIKRIAIRRRIAWRLRGRRLASVGATTTPNDNPTQQQHLTHTRRRDDDAQCDVPAAPVAVDTHMISSKRTVITPVYTHHMNGPWSIGTIIHANGSFSVGSGSDDAERVSRRP
jgi:hypothetical protein